jgi:NAD(P)-dependent dehydrogenase (short-subunit alcohol dehydrogenase family)
VVNLLDQKLFNPNPDYFAYTLSKAALLEATRLLAQALAPSVRVCGVAPGLTLTSELIAPERLQQLQASTPLGHGVAPADVAQAVAYLLGARSVTGHVLVVDAGSHLFPATRDFAFLAS